MLLRSIYQYAAPGVPLGPNPSLALIAMHSSCRALFVATPVDGTGAERRADRAIHHGGARARCSCRIERLHDDDGGGDGGGGGTASTRAGGGWRVLVVCTPILARLSLVLCCTCSCPDTEAGKRPSRQDGGARALAAALRSQRCASLGLGSLDLRGNGIGEAVGEELQAAVAATPTLQAVALSDNPIEGTAAAQRIAGAAAINALRAAGATQGGGEWFRSVSDRGLGEVGGVMVADFLREVRCGRRERDGRVLLRGRSRAMPLRACCLSSTRARTWLTQKLGGRRAG
jgi:hypothetical protein